jgi:hypothetical protein
MNYSTVEDFIASFPRPVLPTVQGEPDYQTINATRKFLHANSRAIVVNTSGKAGAQIPHLPLGDDSSPHGR